MGDTPRSKSPLPDDWFPEYDHLATHPSIDDPAHPLHDSQPDDGDELAPSAAIGPEKTADHSSQSRASSDVQSTRRRVNTPSPDETSELEGEQEEEDEDEINRDYRYKGERDNSAVQANAKVFKYLHVPGEPVFVVNVHDLLTASIAAQQPECQALCVDLPTLYHLVGWRYANRVEFLAENCYELITAVSGIAQRNGKLLTVDMGTQDYYLLQQFVPYLLGLGVRIEAVQFSARQNLVTDFVINAVMEWPGTVDYAIDRANQYLDNGAAAVTILRRIPSPDLPPAEFLRLVHGIKGRVGVVLQMPNMGSPPCKASDVAKAKVARIGFGNQWPYHIRIRFQKSVKLLFSD